MIYLNNAATSFPKPDSIIKKTVRCLSEIPDQQMRGGSARMQYSLESCRRIVSDFFGVTGKGNIIFTSGATQALNTLIFGIIKPGWKVVSTVTEHNSVLRPLFRLEDTGMIELKLIGCDRDGHIDPEELSSEVKNGVSAVVVNHVSNVTGAVQDLEVISGICSGKGIKLIVDASQSCGHIPIENLSEGSYAFAFTGHKGLMGIQGSGGFFLPEDMECRPLTFGGTGSRSDLRGQPEQLPERLEAGTRNLPGAVSMAAGMEWIITERREKIFSHGNKLSSLLCREFSKIEKVRMYGGDGAETFSDLLSFNMDGFSADDLSFILENSYGIITRAGLHCAPLIHNALGTSPGGAVRVSFSYFNTVDEVLELAEAVRTIAESGVGR